MEILTSNWFECRVAYEKTDENGVIKRVTEKYVVPACSHSDAEERIIEEMSAYNCGGLEVRSIVPAQYKEIFLCEAGDGEEAKWYKAKLHFITLDERTEKEKITTAYYLVQGTTLLNACKNLHESMKGSLIDYVIVGLNEQPIIEVLTEEKVSKDAE